MARTQTATRIASSASFLERQFALSERGTDPGIELRAGLTTFVVMSYLACLG